MPNRNYICVLLDQYPRCSIVAFTTSKSAKYLVPIIDNIFVAHGFLDTVKTDEGLPFNGNGSHQYQMYMKCTGVKTNVVTAEDPEANGFAENFMKVLDKI